eukprot:1194827-Prorocentrum_minimum.AAC.1
MVSIKKHVASGYVPSGYVDLPTWCEAYIVAKASSRHQSSTSSACSSFRMRCHSVDSIEGPRLNSSSSLGIIDKVTSLDGAALHATPRYRECGTGANAPAEGDINSEDFNQFILRDTELVPAVVGVFESLGLCQRTGVTTAKISKMVQTGMLLYHNQPYHNFRHAFDVFQATNVLLRRTGLIEVASDVEIFSMLVAALLHDGACDLRNSATQVSLWV